MTDNERPETPGYSSHLEIWFSTSRNGRQLAHYWSHLAFRAFRLPLADAELWVAQGLATKVAGHPFKP